MNEIEDLLNQIKQHWPKFVITKENLVKPTPEIVFRFYSNIIEEYNEKVAHLSRVSTSFDFNSADKEPEEQLFLQLSRLLRKINGLKFTLSDIYEPTPIRTRKIFQMCIHFISFTEYLQEEAEQLANMVFKTSIDTAKLVSEQQEVINEIIENAKTKAELNENKNLLEQELKSNRAHYKEMKSVKASREKLYTEKRNQIENLKHELQDMEHKLKGLENVEKDLLEQRVTEKNYQSILSTFESLKSESEMLANDDTDIDDGLVYENQVLQHSGECIELLNKCHFNVEKVKELIKKEHELKIISNDINKLTSTKLNAAKQQKAESELKLAASNEKFRFEQSEYKTVKDNCANIVTQYSQKLKQMQDKLQEKSDSNCKIISNYNRDIEKLEEEMEKMKKTFTTEYIKVSKVEKKMVDEFKDMLRKYKEME